MNPCIYKIILAATDQNYEDEDTIADNFKTNVKMNGLTLISFLRALPTENKFLLGVNFLLANIPPLEGATKGLPLDKIRLLPKLPNLLITDSVINYFRQKATEKKVDLEDAVAVSNFITGLFVSYKNGIGKTVRNPARIDTFFNVIK